MPFDLCINADAIIVKKRSFDLYCYCCFFIFHALYKYRTRNKLKILRILLLQEE